MGNVEPGMTTARARFLPGIEGLRGVSVLVVLLFHAGIPGFGGGFLGVSTFFTLSGFLITGLLIREYGADGRIGLLNFWSRRFRRLMPAALVALAGIAVGGALFGDAIERAGLRGQGLSALFYVANWQLVLSGNDYANLLGSPSPVQHYWSLAIEEQYYVVYPLLVFGLLRAAGGRQVVLLWVLAAACVLGWSWMIWLSGTDVSTARIYFGTDTRGPELLAGGILALAMARRSGSGGPTPRTRAIFSAAGIAALVACFAFWAETRVENTWLYVWGLPAYTLATSLVVMAATHGPVEKVLAYGPLRWLGRISYGVYLYHWPIFLWLNADLPGPLLTLVQIVATFVVADASYRWLEEPIRRGRWILGWHRWVVPPAAIAAVAALFIALAVPVGSPASSSTARALPEASEGDPLRVVVMGDSLGRQVALGLSSFGRETQQIRVVDETRKGCGVARGGWKRESRRDRAVCDRWPDRLRARMASFDPDIVVVATANWDLVERYLAEGASPRVIGDPLFDDWLLWQLGQAHGVLTESGAHVVWLTVPCVHSDKFGAVGPFRPERPKLYNREILPRLAEANRASMTVIDLFSEVCPGGDFVRDAHGMQNFRPDGIHFSQEGTRWVGGWLGEELVSLGKRKAPVE